MGEGLPVMYVTEDTTRADPDTLAKALFDGDSGRSVTGVHRRHRGARDSRGCRGRRPVRAQVVEECGGGVGIDWHGHRDRDFAIENTLAALDAGATRLHGAAIGIGERVGNTPMDILLVNLVLMGYIERDLSALGDYCRVVSEATGVPIPANYPVVGSDAFRTATGVHAAAVMKAFRKNDARWWTRSTPASRRAWSDASRRSKSVRFGQIERRLLARARRPRGRRAPWTGSSQGQGIRLRAHRGEIRPLELGARG